MSTTIKQRVQRIADEVGGEVFEGYSGRGMFGARCWGVTCGRGHVDEVKAAGKRAKLGAASTDNMGLDAIVYWEGAKYEPEPEPKAELTPAEKAARLELVKKVHNAKERVRKAKASGKPERLAEAQAALAALLEGNREAIAIVVEARNDDAVAEAPVVEAQAEPAGVDEGNVDDEPARPADPFADGTTPPPVAETVNSVAVEAPPEPKAALTTSIEAALDVAGVPPAAAVGAWGTLTASAEQLAAVPEPAPEPAKKTRKPREPKAPKEPKVKDPAARWGRPGTAAECYRRIIMEDQLTNAQAFERVKAELGAAAAGKPSYPGWYRAQLKKQGHNPPAEVKPAAAPAEPAAAPSASAN